MSVVEARFAGGHIEVEATTAAWDDTTTVVNVTGPGYTLDMFPHEARDLAKALQEAADAAETTTRELRRPATVDQHLQEVEN